MRGDPLPDEHHFTRYCKGSTISIDGRPTGASFQLRNNEPYLSINWLEHLDLESREAEIREIRRILGSKLTLTRRSRISVLEVGETRNHVREKTPDNIELHMLHEPWSDDQVDDPSHSGIYGLQQDEDMVVELIAQKVQETYPTR